MEWGETITIVGKFIITGKDRDITLSFPLWLPCCIMLLCLTLIDFIVVVGTFFLHNQLINQVIQMTWFDSHCPLSNVMWNSSVLLHLTTEVILQVSYSVLHLSTPQMTVAFMNSLHWSVLVSRKTGDKQAACESTPNKMHHPRRSEVDGGKCLWGVPEDKGGHEPRRVFNFIITHPTSSASI